MLTIQEIEKQLEEQHRKLDVAIKGTSSDYEISTQELAMHLQGLQQTVGDLTTLVHHIGRATRLCLDGERERLSG